MKIECTCINKESTASLHTVSTVSYQPGIVPNLITSKEQILKAYPDVFDGIGHLSGPPYHIHVDPSVNPKQTLCQPISVHLIEPFKQEIDKMLQALPEIVRA